ncbi:class I SAM-dependent DNA methyltransferase [Gorillibacterium massiliense]|uniref:class I SAM-dependent DNA methyltransferase n=1 Tax=Gorillibacterium massiliense TaxID=1280390 RepID=UPI0009DF47F9|nr:class I SAM-dependent methyltransferase [Gorillibacterium massiliense]
MEDMPYREWLAFLEECWNRYGRPETIVDLGCGTGTLTLPLASSGFRMTGIDLSEEMLAAARMKEETMLPGLTSSAGGRVEWLQQDMREWELPRQADAAISLCDCLNYLTDDEDLITAFRQTFAGLKPGGRFIFDMNTPYRYQGYAEEQPFVLDEDDIAYIWTCELEETTCEIEHHLSIFVREQGEKGARDLFYRFEEMHRQRGYDIQWIETALREVGFARVEAFADFTWRPADEETERAFFVAVKP